MDVFLPVCQEVSSGPNFAARFKLWSQTLVLPEEAGPFCLEVAKFLGVLALILVNALILFMAG